MLVTLPSNPLPLSLPALCQTAELVRRNLNDDGVGNLAITVSRSVRSTVGSGVQKFTGLDKNSYLIERDNHGTNIRYCPSTLLIIILASCVFGIDTSL